MQGLNIQELGTGEVGVSSYYTCVRTAVCAKYLTVFHYLYKAVFMRRKQHVWVVITWIHYLISETFLLGWCFLDSKDGTNLGLGLQTRWIGRSPGRDGVMESVLQWWLGGSFLEPDGAWLLVFGCGWQTRQDVSWTHRASLGFHTPVLKTSLYWGERKSSDSAPAASFGASLLAHGRRVINPAMPAYFRRLMLAGFCGFGEVAWFRLGLCACTEVLCSLQTGTAGEGVQGVTSASSPAPSESQEDRDRDQASLAAFSSFAGRQSCVCFKPVLGVQCWGECWIYKSERSSLCSSLAQLIHSLMTASKGNQEEAGCEKADLRGCWRSFRQSPYSKALPTILKPLLAEIYRTSFWKVPVMEILCLS